MIRRTGVSKIFTTGELRNMGFKWVKDGGYWYMIYDNEDSHRVMVTQDVDCRSEDMNHKVYLLTDHGYNNSLDKRDINRIILSRRSS